MFSDGLGLLMALDALEHRPTEIGIAGYPEGHPRIPRTRLMASLLEKQTFGDHVTTQRCFDAVTTIAGISEVRENGVNRDEAEEGVQPGG